MTVLVFRIVVELIYNLMAFYITISLRNGNCFCMGSIVICIGGDVNSLSAANNQSLARDVSLKWRSLTATKKFKYIYLNFDVFALYIYMNIFAHTSCTLAYNTSRHCTHTSHRWVASSKWNSFLCSLWSGEKVSFFWVSQKCGKLPFWLFFGFRALSLFIKKMLPLVLF